MGGGGGASETLVRVCLKLGAVSGALETTDVLGLGLCHLAQSIVTINHSYKTTPTPQT